MAMFFSARLDETGTDGRSPYAMVAGGVSVPQLWDKLETSWERLLESRKVSAFHTKEFSAREGDFEGWGELKCKNFAKAQEKVIKKNITMQIAVAVHRDTHAKIKKKWVGVKNFKADSDCGICFRVARFIICEKLVEWKRKGIIETRPRLQLIIEDGPYASDAAVIYQDIKSTIGAKYRPAMHAEMLAGFANIPKGELRSLEAADYIAGRAIRDLERGTFIKPGRSEQISLLMTPEFLDHWNEDMLKEREHRKAFGRRTSKNDA